MHLNTLNSHKNVQFDAKCITTATNLCCLHGAGEVGLHLHSLWPKYWTATAGKHFFTPFFSSLSLSSTPTAGVGDTWWAGADSWSGGSGARNEASMFLIAEVCTPSETFCDEFFLHFLLYSVHHRDRLYRPALVEWIKSIYVKLRNEDIFSSKVSEESYPRLLVTDPDMRTKKTEGVINMIIIINIFKQFFIKTQIAVDQGCSYSIVHITYSYNFDDEEKNESTSKMLTFMQCIMKICNYIN